MIGTQLGRWVIDRELGKGAMGAVYFAHAADAPDEVRALKVLAPDLARDPVARQRFQRETDVLCQLDHPNIVRFDGAGLDGETLYYVMEFVDGPDCETRLRDRGRWPWAEVLDAAIQVARGLKYAHDQGIVHRDLKPANILLTANDRAAAGDDDETPVIGRPPQTIAKIADFGVARVFSQGQLTGSGQFIGTALYMAPEQAAGKPATKRSDFYALGCTMYTLLTGRPPFNGTSIAELVHKHQFAQPERPSRLLVDLPHDIDLLVVQLLAKDPGQRPADGSVLVKKLESIRGKLGRKLNVSDTPFRSTSAAAHVGGGLWNTGESRVFGLGFDLAKVARAAMLLAALALVVGLISWKLSRPRASAAELFGHAQRLMRSADPDDWDKAWSDYLDPMIARFPDHPYGSEVEAFRHQLDEAKSLRRIAGRRRGPVRSEAQRFYELGLTRCQNGDIDGGRKLWQRMIDAFGPVESEQPWVGLARRKLDEVPPREVGSAETPEIKAALAGARQLAADGHRDRAEAVWKGLEELYRDDPLGSAIRDAVRAERDRKAPPE